MNIKRQYICIISWLGIHSSSIKGSSNGRLPSNGSMYPWMMKRTETLIANIFLTFTAQNVRLLGISSAQIYYEAYGVFVDDIPLLVFYPVKQ
jgi:hypothetical protein